jgi:hypothetical protein
MENNRRNFAKGLGLAGLFLAGVAGYKEVKERIVYKQDEIPTAELEKQLEGKPTLQLAATYGEELPPAKIYGTKYVITGINPTYKPGTEKYVTVKLVPGPDGKLYVKENDSWRKI